MITFSKSRFTLLTPLCLAALLPGWSNSARAQDAQPDLIVTGLTAEWNKETREFKYSVRVANQGEPKAGLEKVAVNNYYRLSTDAKFDEDDPAFYIVNMWHPWTPTTEYQHKRNRTYPLTRVNPETHPFLVFKTDNKNTVPESNEENNTRAVRIKIIDPKAAVPPPVVDEKEVCLRLKTMTNDFAVLIELARRRATHLEVAGGRTIYLHKIAVFETRVRLLESLLGIPWRIELKSLRPANDLTAQLTLLEIRFARLVEAAKEENRIKRAQIEIVGYLETVKILEEKVHLVQVHLQESLKVKPPPQVPDLSALDIRLIDLVKIAVNWEALEATDPAKIKCLQHVVALESQIIQLESVLRGISIAEVVPLPDASGDLAKRLKVLDHRYGKLIELSRQAGELSEGGAAAVLKARSEQVGEIDRLINEIKSLLEKSSKKNQGGDDAGADNAGGDNAGGDNAGGDKVGMAPQARDSLSPSDAVDADAPALKGQPAAPTRIARASGVETELAAIDERVSGLTEIAERLAEVEGAGPAKEAIVEQVAALESQIHQLESALKGTPAAGLELLPEPSGGLTERLAALDDRIAENSFDQETGALPQPGGAGITDANALQLAGIERQARELEALLGDEAGGSAEQSSPVDNGDGGRSAP